MIRTLTAIAVAGAVLATWLFPRAFPIVVLSNRITREAALQRADSFARAHALPPGARIAVQFTRDDSLHTFIDFAGGGRDSLEALVRGNDAAPYRWSVRAFTPNDVHETRVHMAADGRFIGFERRMAEADARPPLDSAAARRVADDVLSQWLRESPERWRLAASSYETRKASGRVDRTFTYERQGRRVAGAPIRLDIVVAGDTPSLARPYVDVPESFLRRYGEMRASNELFSNAALAAMLAIAVAGALALRRFSRDRRVRWRPAMLVGGIVAALVAAAGLNALSSLWYGYDTATSPAVFQALIVTAGIAGAVSLGLLVAVTLAAAEAAARTAFPNHMDWWQLWTHRGSREVAVSVAGGYALAATGIAYVSAFYLVTRGWFGWWVPAEVLDDPNQIATALPWLAGLAASFQAAVWEEALFRALPLSLLSLWVGTRPRRSLWMAAGVVASALVFGFAHSDYPSWPAYSRGLEIFLEACLWGALFLRFGILMTVVAHFLFNMTLFGMFAASGTTLPYLVSATIVVSLLLAPALAVAWRWVRQRGLLEAPAQAKSGAWLPADEAQPTPTAPPISTGALSERARRVAWWTLAAGIVAALLTPRSPVLGPRYTITRARATLVADSMLGARGIDVASWKRLATSATDSMQAWPRFLRHEKSESLAESLSATYAVPAWWIVRYVHTAGPLGTRAEEWRVRVRPDGVPIDVRHIVPDSAAGKTLTPDQARRVARGALARAGLDTTVLREVNLEETPRPSRRDTKVTYTDTTVRLPADAAARAWVSMAGDNPLVVRRGIELPERFVRDDRGRQLRRMVIAAVLALALVAIVITGAIVVIRRRPPLVDDLALGGRMRLGLLAGVATLMMLASLNNLPSELAGYDTAKPWSSFLTSTGIQLFAGAVFTALVFAGLWLTADALRRRVGVPVWAQSRANNTLSDGLVAGMGLGGMFALMGLAGTFARMMSDSEIPSPPEPLFDTAVPLVSGALDVLISAIAMLPLAAIPVLVIVGLAQRMRWRVLLSIVLLALGVGAAMAVSDAAPSPVAVVVRLATLAALVLAVRAWATTCAMTWVVAALSTTLLSLLHGAVMATDPTALGTRVLAAAVAVGMLVYLERAARVNQRA